MKKHSGGLQEVGQKQKSPDLSTGAWAQHSISDTADRAYARHSILAKAKKQKRRPKLSDSLGTRILSISCS